MIETQAFLARHGYGRARRTPLAGDASARRYERLTGGPTPAILMHSPPQIGVEPFRSVARWLHACGMSAPEIIATDAEIGQVLLEDLGDDLFSRVLARDGDEASLYAAAVDLLLDLQRRPPPPDLPAYDDAKLLAEALLLTEWYAPDAPADGYLAIWQALLPWVRVGAACLVYVDDHADNLLWLPERQGHRRVGLLDFQDARLGPPAYDLVSLLEDARRDVPPALAEAMIARYLAARPDLEPEAFRTAYAVLGAQRNAKILGLFTRLARRDGKTAYLALLPRVRAHLQRDLAHPILAPLQAWFAEHAPRALHNPRGYDSIEKVG
jgi:aminoglycoside/choline kinase family phosphotransferase